MPELASLTEAEASEWLARYGIAWETGDFLGAGSLFSEDAVYHEDPFDVPMCGRDQIQQYWKEGAADAQEDVTFGFEIWAVAHDQCFSHWHASFTRIRDGQRIALDGAFRLKFERAAGELLCSSLQEWWHRREVTR
jgi:ketosteroid isomerase-like protein